MGLFKGSRKHPINYKLKLIADGASHQRVAAAASCMDSLISFQSHFVHDLCDFSDSNHVQTIHGCGLRRANGNCPSVTRETHHQYSRVTTLTA